MASEEKGKDKKEEKPVPPPPTKLKTSWVTDSMDKDLSELIRNQEKK